uniref:Peptidase S1 domain-containing protein n=1 Tax=Rhabditophanes sp. KR3021 TaxID=114890 RepID=A0AC35TQD6_9BILA
MFDIYVEIILSLAILITGHQDGVYQKRMDLFGKFIAIKNPRLYGVNERWSIPTVMKYDATHCGIPVKGITSWAAKADIYEACLRDDLEKKASRKIGGNELEEVLEKCQRKNSGTNLYDPIEGTFEDKVEQKISGGEDIPISQDPWAVQIWYQEHFICGGTLIGKNYVVSAGHCIFPNCNPAHKLRRDIKYLEVVINMEFKPSVLDREKVIRDDINFYPPTYAKVKTLIAPFSGKKTSNCDGSNDFAVLELDIVLPDGYIHACLPFNRDPLYKSYNTGFYVAGFGQDAAIEFATHNKLTKLKLTQIYDGHFCKDSGINSRYVCVFDEPGKGVCQGDSGSGLMKNIGRDLTFDKSYPHKTYIVGILSRGVECNLYRKAYYESVQYYTSIYEFQELLMLLMDEELPQFKGLLYSFFANEPRR